jgi:hypothetical protein
LGETTPPVSAYNNCKKFSLKIEKRGFGNGHPGHDQNSPIMLVLEGVKCTRVPGGAKSMTGHIKA